MSTIESDYQILLKDYWDNYVQQDVPLPDYNPGVRDFIYESWKRSKDYNVNPFEVKDMALSDDELKIALKKNRNLIQIAHSYLKNLYQFVKGTNFILVLTDAKGYVLDLVCSDDVIQSRTQKTGLRPGSCRSEEYAGTNGIGTCLATGKPLQILGVEHYIKPHHNYVCTASPIHDETGEIIGCVDVIGLFDAPHNHTLAMVTASTDGIEKEMRMKKAYDHISVINNQMSSMIQYISSGIVMLDMEGTIMQYNDRLFEICNVPKQSLHKENVLSFIDFERSNIDFNTVRTDFQNKEVTFFTKNGQQIHVSLSASRIKDADGNQVGTVLVLDELKKIHSLVNRTLGFSAIYNFESIHGISKSLNETKEFARSIANGNSNILILGESGTGKELFAQSIHNASNRADKPFIPINCGSLPKGLVESELFGYEKGAFTGARKDGHPGKFELANGGTIFLDEIGDMPLELQASLLRVLQTKEVVRIGGRQTKMLDVRVIAATNVDLYEAVQRNEFRSDLYYRLNVLSIQIPPLRERREDIPSLTDYFIQQHRLSSDKGEITVSPKARQLMDDYSWPGNVRELENVIERALNLTTNGIITEKELPSNIANSKGADIAEAKTTGERPVPSMPQISEGEETPQFETAKENRTYALLVEALSLENGNISKAAVRLGISKRTLYRRIEKYNIDVNNFRLL